jgi:hypothetical protein
MANNGNIERSDESAENHPEGCFAEEGSFSRFWNGLRVLRVGKALPLRVT